MKRPDDVERLLEETPAPSVIEGPHRRQLKARLLRRAQQMAKPPRALRSLLFARPVKAAAACLAAAALVTIGWHAGRLHRAMTAGPSGPDGEVPLERAWPTSEISYEITMRQSAGPGAPGDAVPQEDSQLDANGKQYVYRFALANGEEQSVTLSSPVREVWLSAVVGPALASAAPGPEQIPLY